MKIIHCYKNSNQNTFYNTRIIVFWDRHEEKNYRLITGFMSQLTASGK